MFAFILFIYCLWWLVCELDGFRAGRRGSRLSAKPLVFLPWKGIGLCLGLLLLIAVSSVLMRAH